MTEKSASPRPNNDVATGCVRFVIALLILFWVVFVAYVAIYAGSGNDPSPVARGAIGVLLLSLVAVWKLAERWPIMRTSFAFAVGLIIVLIAAAELIIQMGIHHIDSKPAAIGVLVVALVAIVALARWALRRSSALDAMAPTPTSELPKREGPP